MGNTLVNRRDQDFVLYEQLDIQKLFGREHFADYSKETVDMMLNEAEKMAVEIILPTHEDGDKVGVAFKEGKVFVPKSYHEAWRKFTEAGWISSMRGADVGGQGMPASVYAACYELFNAANFSFIMYPGLTNGSAGLIETFGTKELKERYMYKMYSGEWGGTMCLTEPGAGSDVGALKATAKKLPDGTYSITGNKIFISSGDHDLTPNIVHAVLARIEGDPPGTRGISIFAVPKYRVKPDGSIGEFNDVKTGNIEHKMGIKGSATCTLVFGEDGKCVGELLGRERDGMRIMFKLMNEARLEVGSQALGVASAAYEHAVQYAKERIQGTEIFEMKDPNAKPVPIIHHPDIRRTLLWMKAHVEGMRSLLYQTYFCIDMEESAETKEEKEKWQGLVDVLVPICKAYISDKSFLVCSKAVDVYGGYGYCSEYPVEHYLRDCKITAIYEGTNGIQALDLVGRKIGMKKGMHLLSMVEILNMIISSGREFEELKQSCQYLDDARNALTDLTLHFYRLGKGSGFLIPILYAQPYLELFGDVAIGSLLMQQAEVAALKLKTIYAERGARGSKAKQRALVHQVPDVAFYQGKVAVARFFAVNVLSTIRARCEAVKVGDRVPVEMAEESFSA